MDRTWPLLALLLTALGAGCTESPAVDDADLTLPVHIENARGRTLQVEVTFEHAETGVATKHGYTVAPGRHVVDTYEVPAGTYDLEVVVEDMQTRVLGQYGSETQGIDIRVLPDGISSGPMA